MAEWLLGRLRFLVLCVSVWLLGMVAARGLPAVWPAEAVAFAADLDVVPSRQTIRWASPRGGPQGLGSPAGEGGDIPELLLDRHRRVHSGYRVHVIRPGDTLWDLARSYGVAVTALLTANPGTVPEALTVGEELTIPGVAIGGEGDGTTHYQVQEGDSLWLIAQHYGTTIEALALANGLTNPDLLQPGQILQVQSPNRVQVASRRRERQPAVPALAWPLRGTISSRFGPRWGRLHEGIDIAVSYGTEIRAAAAGTVKEIGWMGGLGLTVLIDHGGGVETAYAHASAILVGPGESVAADQVIAQVGSTGNSTGPHLHFEVRIDEKPNNPVTYLR